MGNRLRPEQQASPHASVFGARAAIMPPPLAKSG